MCQVPDHFVTRPYVCHFQSSAACIFNVLKIKVVRLLRTLSTSVAFSALYTLRV